MRRTLPANLCLLAVLVVPLGSCVELEQTLQIHPDGSGRLDVRVLAKKAVIERFKAQLAGTGLEGDEAEKKDAFDVDRIRKKFKGLEGVHLVRIERIDDETSQGMEASLTFDSTTALTAGMRALVQDGDTKFGNQLQLWFLKADDGNVRLVYYPSGRAEYDRAKQQIAALEKMDEAQRQMQKQMFDLMKTGLEDLKITYRFKVPGEIARVEGARKVEAKQALYTVLGKSITSMGEMAKIGAVRFVIDFDGEGFKGPLLAREPETTAVSQPAKAKGSKDK